MAAGVPVLATNVPGIRDVVRHGETGLLVPCDAGALAAALERLVEHPALRRAARRGGAGGVRRRFTWSAVLPQYRELLKLRVIARDHTSSSNSSTSFPNRFIAASTGSGVSMSTPASRSRSSGYLQQPPLRKPR